MQNQSAPLGANVHKLPLAPAKAPRISKAMRALLETTVAEKESEAYERGLADGRLPGFVALLVGICCGGVSGFVVGLLVHFAARAV